MMPDVRVWRCLAKIAQYQHWFPLVVFIDARALEHAAPLYALEMVA